MVRPPDKSSSQRSAKNKKFRSGTEVTQTIQPIFQRAWIRSDQSSNGDAGRRFFPEKQFEEAIRVRNDITIFLNLK
jgi:hypothetical protein